MNFTVAVPGFDLGALILSTGRKKNEKKNSVFGIKNKRSAAGCPLPLPLGSASVLNALPGQSEIASY